MKKVHLPLFIIQTTMLFLMLSFIAVCTNDGSSGKKNEKQEKAEALTPAQYKKPPSSFQDTLVININSAVFYYPDSLQLDKIKSLSKKENYETEVHNCFYLMRNARIVLKKYWPAITIVESKSSRYLLFVKKDKSKYLIDLNSLGDMCGVFLFDGKKEPELADMMNIDTALGFYFGK